MDYIHITNDNLIATAEIKLSEKTADVKLTLNSHEIYTFKFDIDGGVGLDDVYYDSMRLRGLFGDDALGMEYKMIELVTDAMYGRRTVGIVIYRNNQGYIAHCNLYTDKIMFEMKNVA